MYTLISLVPMAVGVHPFPSRTRQLSPLALKILGWKRPGKISRCQHQNRSTNVPRFFCALTGKGYPPAHKEPIGILDCFSKGFPVSSHRYSFGNNLARLKKLHSTSSYRLANICNIDFHTAYLSPRESILEQIVHFFK